jgi:dihydrofolate reductase
MRKVLATAFVSLDGVMQAPGGPQEDPTGGFELGGWTAPFWDEAIEQVMGGIFSVPYELLLGRKTYEIFNAHWPHAKDDPFAEALTNVRKYVATTSKEPLTWKNSIAIHDVPRDIARLKQEDGPTLMTQGSSDLIQTLLKHDLIDRFTLLIYPVVLGRGKRLFGTGTMPGTLELIESKATPSGVTINTYERAGAVKVGSFAHEQPSADELKRRERMKREG